MCNVDKLRGWLVIAYETRENVWLAERLGTAGKGKVEAEHRAQDDEQQDHQDETTSNQSNFKLKVIVMIK